MIVVENESSLLVPKVVGEKMVINRFVLPGEKIVNLNIASFVTGSTSKLRWMELCQERDILEIVSNHVKGIYKKRHSYLPKGNKSIFPVGPSIYDCYYIPTPGRSYNTGPERLLECYDGRLFYSPNHYRGYSVLVAQDYKKWGTEFKQIFFYERDMT